jgi:hypothetical protein
MTFWLLKCSKYGMGIRAGSHRIPSLKAQVPLMLANPNMEVKSQFLSLKKPLKYDYKSLKSSLDHFM